MGQTVTVRLDAETGRVLRALSRRRKATKSAVVREALRTEWKSEDGDSRPTAWEVYSKLDIPPPRGRKHNRARNAKKLIREMLLAKRRNGTL